MKKTLLFLLITVTASVLAMAGLGLANNAFKSPKADTESAAQGYSPLADSESAAVNMAIQKELKTSGTTDYRTIVPWEAAGFGSYVEGGGNIEDSYSVGMWFRPTGAHSSHKGLLMSHGTGNHCNINGLWYFTIDTNGQIAIGENDDAVNGKTGLNGTTVGTVAFNEWHYLLFTIDNVNRKAAVYVDGTQKVNQELAGPLTYKWKDGMFHFASHGFGGELDQAEIYNTALTEAEAAQAYVDASKVASIQALYTFDEVAAGTTSQFANTLDHGTTEKAVFQKYVGQADWGNGPIDNGSHQETEYAPTLVQGREITVAPTTCTLTVVSNGCEYGLADYDNMKAIDGTEATLAIGTNMLLSVLAAPDGMQLKEVTLNGTPIDGEEGTYNFVVNEDATLEMVVEDIPTPTYAVTVEDNGATVETEADLTAVEEGTEVTFTITAPEGMQIASVTYNGAEVAANADGTYTITVTADGTLTVTTEEITTPEPQPAGNKAVKFLATQTYANTYVKPQGDDRIEIPETILTSRTGEEGDFVTIETSFTYSGWFNLNDWYKYNDTGSGMLLIGQRVHANNNPSIGLIVVRPKGYNGTTNPKRTDGILKLVCADPQNSSVGHEIEGEDAAISLDEWMYLTMVYDKDAQEVRVYKNGKRIDTQACAIPLRLLPDYPGIISTGAFALNGACDELQLWTKALTDAEVLTAYYTPDKVSGLDLWYDFDTIIPATEEGAESGKFANKATSEKGKDIMATYYHVANAAVKYSGIITDLITFTEKTPELVDGREIMEMPSYTVTIPEVTGGTFTVSDGTQTYAAGEHKFNVGTNLTATVTPNDGYYLTALKYAGEYIDNGATVAVEADAAFEVTLTDAVRTITIAETEATYNISAPNGSELDLANVPEGTEIQLTITGWPEDKTLKEVRLGDEVLEADENGVYSFTVGESTTLTIELRDLEQFTINYTAILENGSLEVKNDKGVALLPGATVFEGSTITVAATPAAGYSTLYVRINGEDVEESSPYTVTSDIEVTADFAAAVAYIPGRQRNGSSTHNYSFRFSEDALGEHTAGTCDEPAEVGTTDKRSRNFTYAAWIKPTNRSVYGKDPMGRLMGDIQSGSMATDGAFSVEMTAEGKLALNARVYSSATSMPGIDKLITDTDIALDEWTFLAVVSDNEAKTLSLYKDGELCGTLDLSKDSEGNEAYGIGLLPEASQFYVYEYSAAGYLEEVQLWTKALTQQDIRRATRLNKNKQYDGLVSYYRPRLNDQIVPNTSTSNTITAALYAGMFTSNKWVTPKEQIISEAGAAHEPETVTVNIVQPTDNIGTFTITGEEGRVIDGTAYLFEDLTVDLSNISGAEVNGITVTTDGNVTDYTLEQLPFTIDGNSEIALNYEVKSTVLFTYTGEHGKVSLKVNDEEAVEYTEPVEVPKNSTVIITAIPDEHYELTAAVINGETVYDLYKIEDNEEDGETYDFYDNEYTLQVEEKNVNVELTFNLERFFLYAEVLDAAGDDTDLYPAFTDAEGTNIDDDNVFDIMVPYGTDVWLSIWSVTPDSYGENDGHNVLGRVWDYPYDNVQGYLDAVDVTDQLVAIPTGEEEDLMYHIGEVTQSHFFYISQSYAGILSISADANNPLKVVNGIITLGENAVIEVTDMNGRMVARTEGSELNVQQLVKGVYVAKATTADKVYTLKFIML